MNKRVLVTGGAGFVGSHIIRYILSKYSDYRVINFDYLTPSASLNRLSAEENNPMYTFYEGDISNEKDVQYVFEQYKPNYVIHLASQSYIDKDIHQPNIFIQTNVVGTQLILQNARESNVERMVQLSTGKVYGSYVEGTDIDENSRLLPYSPYAASKAAADLFIAAAHRRHKLNVSVVRPTNAYGPFQFTEKLIPAIIYSIIKDKKIPVFGDGSSYRDWVYVSDFCQAIDLVLHKGKAGEIYNISSQESIRNIDIVKLILKKLDGAASKIDYLKERIGDESYPAIKSEKIRKELGWKPKYDLDKGIDETIHWYKNNSEWVEEVHSGNYQKK